MSALSRNASSATKDIAAEMVRLKQACDWPQFSGGHYRIDEKTCVNTKRGH